MFTHYHNHTQQTIATILSTTVCVIKCNSQCIFIWKRRNDVQNQKNMFFNLNFMHDHMHNRKRKRRPNHERRRMHKHRNQHMHNHMHNSQQALITIRQHKIVSTIVIHM